MHPVVTLCTLHHLALVVVVFIAACTDWAVVPWGKKLEVTVRAARAGQSLSRGQSRTHHLTTTDSCLPCTLQTKKRFVDKSVFSVALPSSKRQDAVRVNKHRQYSLDPAQWELGFFQEGSRPCTCTTPKWLCSVLIICILQDSGSTALKQLKGRKLLPVSSFWCWRP